MKTIVSIWLLTVLSLWSQTVRVQNLFGGVPGAAGVYTKDEVEDIYRKNPYTITWDGGGEWTFEDGSGTLEVGTGATITGPQTATWTKYKITAISSPDMLENGGGGVSVETPAILDPVDPGVPAKPENYVGTFEQSLTAQRKAQARGNISAASVLDSMTLPYTQGVIRNDTKPGFVRGVTFNGSSQYAMASGFSMVENDFIIEALLSITATGLDQKIIVFDDDGAGAPVFQLRTGETTAFGGNKLLLQTRSGGAYLTAYTNTDVFADSGIKKIKVVKTGTAVSFYVNDVLIPSTGTVHATLTTSATGNIYLARRSGSTPNYMAGTIYRASISQSTQAKEINFIGSNVSGTSWFDTSGYRRTATLTGSPTTTSTQTGGFTIGAEQSAFSPGSNVDTFQGGISNGTHIWLVGSQKIAKYTVAGTLVETVTSSPALTSWGDACLYNGRLYVVRFSDSAANRIYSFDPDDLAATPVLEKELTEITEYGLNGIHRMSDGRWLVGLTNSTVSANKVNKLHILNSSFVLERTLTVPIFESVGIQSIAETDGGLYLSGHDYNNVGPTRIWRVSLNEPVITVEAIAIRTERIGAIVWDPTGKELAFLRRDNSQVSFRAFTETPYYID